MPTNMVTAMAPIATSVRAALRLLGLRNDGTPLLIASTPVSAVQPEAKARSARKIVNAPPTWAVRGSGSWALTAGARRGRRRREISAVASSRKTPKMKPYVGSAKSLAALLDPAQVHQRDQDDEADRRSARCAAAAR